MCLFLAWRKHSYFVATSLQVYTIFDKIKFRSPKGVVVYYMAFYHYFMNWVLRLELTISIWTVQLVSKVTKEYYDSVCLLLGYKTLVSELWIWSYEHILPMTHLCSHKVLLLKSIGFVWVNLTHEFKTFNAISTFLLNLKTQEEEHVTLGRFAFLILYFIQTFRAL